MTEESKEEMQITFKELREAAKPLVEILRKKGHPHMTVLVTDRTAIVVEDKVGVPFPYED